MEPQDQTEQQTSGWSPQAATATGPIMQPMAAANIAGAQAMPQQPIPQGQAAPQMQVQTPTVADLTVPKKGVGLKIALVFLILLLIGVSVFATLSFLDSSEKDAQISDLESQIEDKDEKIKIAVDGLGLGDEEELTQDTLDRIRSEGATRLHIDFTGLTNTLTANWIKVSADAKTMLADVNIGGTGYYYYRKTGNPWKMAYAYTKTVSCRNITKEAMQVVVSMGLEKKTGSNGVKYDCLDTSSNDKMYTFEDALKAEIFKAGSNTSVELNVDEDILNLDANSSATSDTPKNTSPDEGVSRSLDKS